AVTLSDHAPPVMVETLPPDALPSLLAVPTVRRSSARFTVKSPRPLTAKRRNAWRSGELLTRRPGLAPKAVVGAAPSTYVSATAGNMRVVGEAVTVTLALPGALSRSVTLAVGTCVPGESPAATTTEPVPSGPSTLDVQRRPAPRSPSSASTAVAARSTGRPASTPEESAGTSIVTVGATFGGLTTTVRDARPTSQPLSVAAAVTVCVPGRSALVVTLAPPPIRPSRSEVQRMAPDTSPSVASGAVALNVRLVPTMTRVPGAGVAIVTTGGVGVMVTRGGRFGPRTRSVACACAARPSESATAAVIVCVPTWSDDAVTLGPSPSGPSRLEVQWIPVVRSPSSTSRAVPASVTGAPA